MKKIDWVFFDMDGTLADSLEHMYKIYLNFLNEFDIKGNKKEFEKLNGPNLKEIIRYLKSQYNLQKDENTLLKIYENEIENIYIHNVKPIPGREKLLSFLKNNGYKIALVSSASEKTISAFLKKNNWIDYFDLIISGNLIKSSKPNPEIYLESISKSNSTKEKILVLEDSQNGYISACRAGLNCEIISNKSQEEIFSLFS